MEIMEFPLIRENLSYPLYFMSELSQADKNRIALASSSRVVFIKNKTGKIFIRELAIIPSYKFATSKNFNLSTLNFGKNFDFSGIIITKKWGGFVLSNRKFNSGKSIGSFKVKILDSKNPNNNNTNDVEDDCDFQWVCVTTNQGSCEFEHDQLICTTQPVTFCTSVYVCITNDDPPPGGDEPPGLCDYISNETCECQLYGIGCGGEEPPPEGPDPTACQISAANFAAEGSSCSTNLNEQTVSNDGFTWNKTYDWSIYTAGTYGLVSYEKAVLMRVFYPNWARWEFQTVTHETITDVGISIGGTRTFLYINSDINISPSKVMTTVGINFKVTHTVICQPVTPPLTIPHHANIRLYAPN